MTQNNVPQYDPSEPYYIYRRKLEQYFISQQSKYVSDTLDFLNLLFDSDYQHLTDMKKITSIPSFERVIDIIDKHKSLCERLRIKKKDEISDTLILINYLLKKSGFCLVKYGEKMQFYRIKILTN